MTRRQVSPIPVKPAAEPAGVWRGGPWLRWPGARALLLVAAYLAAHVLLRCALSPTLDMDEAEQVVLAQEIRAGYGAQPPLYTWMQALLLGALGPSLLPVVLLKAALLFACFALVHASARRLFPDPARGEAAAAGLLFLPYLVYQTLRDSSHSVGLTAACALCLWLILRLAERRTAAGYAALGAAIAAGCLFKYNVALFLLPALAATLAVPEFRPILRDPRALIAAAVALLLVLPHGLWLLDHLDAATGASIEKLKIKDVSALRGLAKLAECLARFAVAPLACFTIAWPALWRRCGARPPGQRWLSWFLATGLAAMAAMMAASGATDLSERWLLPLLFCLPLWLVARVPDIGGAGGRRFAGCVGFAGVALPLALAGHVWFGPAWGKPLRKNIDLAPLAAAADAHGPPRAIVAQNHFLGGNLKLRFPQARVHVPGRFSPDAPIAAPVWIVWQSRSSGFRKAVTRATGAPWDSLHPRDIALPWFFGANVPPSSASLAVVEAPPPVTR